MKGELGRFGEGTEQKKEGYRRVSRRGDDLAAQVVKGRNLQAARDPGEQDHPRHQGEPPAAGDQQRLLGRLARPFPVMVKADEQVGGDAGQLPEKKKGDHIVGEDQPEHGGHEETDIEIETAGVGILFHIGPGVEKNRHADEGDDQDEGEAEAVEHEGEVDAEFRYPGGALPDDPAVSDFAIAAEEADEKVERKGDSDPAEPGLEALVEQRPGG